MLEGSTHSALQVYVLTINVTEEVNKTVFCSCRSWLHPPTPAQPKLLSFLSPNLSSLCVPWAEAEFMNFFLGILLYSWDPPDWRFLPSILAFYKMRYSWINLSFLHWLILCMDFWNPRGGGGYGFLSFLNLSRNCRNTKSKKTKGGE